MVGSRWVNKIKAYDLFKSGLVVLGWAQVPGIDCGGTFAPVCKLQSIHMMLVIAADLDYEVLMLDVQTAFLNADVEEEEVYVKMAPGYETYDKSGVPFVTKLRKTLYGLRPSLKNWFGNMDDNLSNRGFRSLKSDPCVYVFEDKTGTAILPLYVDILLFSNNKQLLGKLKKTLTDRFEITDLGDVSKVLDMNVTRDRQN